MSDAAIQIPARVVPFSGVGGLAVVDRYPWYSMSIPTAHLAEKTVTVSAENWAGNPGTLLVWIDIASAVAVAPGTGLGDINQDGYVDDADMGLLDRIILTTFVPTAEQFRRADVNQDGVVNALDITAMEWIAENQGMTLNPWSTLGIPSVLVPGGRRSCVLSWRTHSKLARVTLQAPAFVSDQWSCVAYFEGS